MFRVAVSALAASGLLSSLAVAAFAWSTGAARALLITATLLSAVAGVAAAAAGHGALAAAAFVLAWAACGSNVNAARQLLAHPARWIHRFVIYAGYGATFAAMAAASLWLDARGAAGWPAAGLLGGAWAIGSTCIFAAKTLTVRRASRTRPEYAASLADPQGQAGYW
jgi:hypothetical protein